MEDALRGFHQIHGISRSSENRKESTFNTVPTEHAHSAPQKVQHRIQFISLHRGEVYFVFPEALYSGLTQTQRRVKDGESVSLILSLCESEKY